VEEVWKNSFKWGARAIVLLKPLLGDLRNRLFPPPTLQYSRHFSSHHFSATELKDGLVFRNEALSILVTDCSHLQRLHYPFLSVSNPAGGSLSIHRIETCSSSTQLRSLAHNNEGGLSHPAQTNINHHSCEFLRSSFPFAKVYGVYPTYIVIIMHSS
jgi:hypothetical protein